MLLASCSKDMGVNAVQEVREDNIEIVVNVGETDSLGLAKRIKSSDETVVEARIIAQQSLAKAGSTADERIDTISLSSAILRLEEHEGSEIILDTLTLKGLRNKSALSTYLDPEAPRVWLLDLVAFDEKGDTTHTAEGILRTNPEERVTVTINLVITVHVISGELKAQ
ncbi:hypothetical protein GF382_00575 [Candidatus Falkowbacteria bacterium]|nr:hypothetical protein [Candidatus Falkowbacteria bacterium]